MIPTPTQRLMCFEIKGKIGKGRPDNPLGMKGIYQTRPTKKGKITVKMVYYAPTNPRTVAQQANRQKFADAMSAWVALTPTAKDAYCKRAKKLQKFGWGLFIKEYFTSH